MALIAKVGLDKSDFSTGLTALKNEVGSLKSGAVAGTFKSLAQDLATANSPAEMLSATMNRLATSLKGTFLGAAGLAIGKLLASPFEQLNVNLEESANRAKTAINAISKAGGDVSFDEAKSQAEQLKSAIDEIGSSIQKIQGNPFLRLADTIMGVTKEMKLLQESLQRVAASQLTFGVAVDSKNAQQLVGKTDEEKQKIRIRQDADAKIARLRDELPGTGLNLNTAIKDVRAEEAAKLKDMELQRQQRNQQDVLKATEQIAKTEEKIRQSRMSGPALADELIKKYNELTGLRDMFASFGTSEGTAQSAQFGVEAAKIKEQLAGMGRGSGMEILADSLQKVGGGGGFARVGDGSIDYLQRLNDTNNKQLNALINIDRNTTERASGSGVQ
jgi:hypothetical protein